MTRGWWDGAGPPGLLGDWERPRGCPQVTLGWLALLLLPGWPLPLTRSFFRVVHGFPDSVGAPLPLWLRPSTSGHPEASRCQCQWLLSRGGWAGAWPHHFRSPAPPPQLAGAGLRWPRSPWGS